MSLMTEHSNTKRLFYEKLTSGIGCFSSLPGSILKWLRFTDRRREGARRTEVNIMFRSVTSERVVPMVPCGVFV